MSVRQISGTVSVTQTVTNVTIGFDADFILFINDGVNDVWIDVSAVAAAAAPAFPLKATDAPLSVGGITSRAGRQSLGMATFSVICASGETASLRYLAVGN